MLTVSWEDPGPLLRTQMGFVSHAELFRPQQQGTLHRNPWFHSPWSERPNGPPVMCSFTQPAISGHKYRLKATWHHKNETEITRPCRTSASGCHYRANSWRVWQQNQKWFHWTRTKPNISGSVTLEHGNSFQSGWNKKVCDITATVIFMSDGWSHSRAFWGRGLINSWTKTTLFTNFDGAGSDFMEATTSSCLNSDDLWVILISRRDVKLLLMLHNKHNICIIHEVELKYKGPKYQLWVSDYY